MTDHETPRRQRDMHEVPGPRFTVGEIAQRLAEYGEDTASIAQQVRGFAQRGLIRSRGLRGTGRTASNLYAVPDVAVAKVLRTLTKFGIADNAIMNKASVACYAWAEGREIVDQDPITAAISGFLNGEYWIFQLQTLVHMGNGSTEYFASVLDPKETEVGYDPADGYESIGSLIVPIYRFLPIIFSDREGMN